jgi:hypothetical protein
MWTRHVLENRWVIVRAAAASAAAVSASVPAAASAAAAAAAVVDHIHSDSVASGIHRLPTASGV